MFIRARSGLVLRNPYTKTLVPDTGIHVGDFDLFWSRLLADGDIEIIEETPAPAISAATAKKDR